MTEGPVASDESRPVDDWPPPLTSAVGPADVVVVSATGPDRASYLDAVLSQRLREVPAGTAAGALELGPNGEPNGVMDLTVLDDRIVLLVPEAIAEDVVGRLAGRTFLSEVVFEVDDDAVVARLRGPAAHDDAARAGVPTPAGTATADDGLLRVGDDHGVLLVGRPDVVTSVTERLVAAGVARGDGATLDALEIVTGRPRPPEEIARGRLPEELGLLATHVHLAKGCYPGQEAVARMWQLGRPRRRLAVLTGEDPITPGTHGETGSKVEVTRAAVVDGHRVALGFVPRDTAVGDTVGGDLVVRALPGDGRPVPGHDPQVTRRRDTR